MVSAKQQAKEAIDQLPDDCTMEDIQYQLYVTEVIRRRLEMADQGDTVSHEEAEKRMEKWLVD